MCGIELQDPGIKGWLLSVELCFLCIYRANDCVGLHVKFITCLWFYGVNGDMQNDCTDYPISHLNNYWNL